MFVRSALLLALIGYSAASKWAVDGGDFHRTSRITVANDILKVESRRTVVYENKVEQGSHIDEHLLQSPLITSFGYIVVAADNCELSIMNDPANINPNDPWGPMGGTTWKPPAMDFTPVFTGYAMDSDDIVYIFDRRNLAIFAVHVLRQSPYFQLKWTRTLGHSEGFNFDEDVSMIPLTHAKQLWIPLKATTMESPGMAIVIRMDADEDDEDAVTVIEIPREKTAECKYPHDSGSAVVSLPDGRPGVSILSSRYCGMQIYDPEDLSYPVFESMPDIDHAFEYGEHSHPVYDPDTGNFYYVDWSVSQYLHQTVCCLNSKNHYNYCPGWAGGCRMIPELDSGMGPEGPTYSRWTWMALTYYRDHIYVVTSGVLNNEVMVENPNDLVSTVQVYSTKSGKPVASHRFTGDLFNSAPLIVVPNNNRHGEARLYVSSSTGKIYAYPLEDRVSNGYAWVNKDFEGVPLSSLPSTTYAYMSATEAGTLLVTASNGDASNWMFNKAFYAVVNGVHAPSAPKKSGGKGGKVALAIFLTILIITALVVAYHKVRAVRNVFEPVVVSVKNLFSKSRGSGSGFGSGDSGGFKNVESSYSDDAESVPVNFNANIANPF